MQVCPICRASLNGVSVCRRCRADLGKVQEIEQRGRILAVTALCMLVEGDADTAARWLERARSVHAAPAVRTLERLANVTGAADQTE
jgi:hypothetical protein